MSWWKSIVPALLAAGSTLAGCVPSEHGQPVRPHYVLGPAWQAGDVWFYPAVEASYDETGLAVVEPASRREWHTADGELDDPAALAAAHQTLPLPAIVDVINLENGRSLLLRLNDRGPAAAGRLLAVTPAAARLLGMRVTEPARVRVILDSARTRTVLATVADAPPPDIVAAPLEPVAEQPLDGPNLQFPSAPGVGRSQRRVLPRDFEPDGTVRIVVADPGRLWVEVGRFSARDAALTVARRLGADVHVDRQQAFAFSVRLGPFDRVPDADDALDRAHVAGLTGARIIVQ